MAPALTAYTPDNGLEITAAIAPAGYSWPVTDRDSCMSAEREADAPDRRPDAGAGRRAHFPSGAGAIGLSASRRSRGCHGIEVGADGLRRLPGGVQRQLPGREQAGQGSWQSDVFAPMQHMRVRLHRPHNARLKSCNPALVAQRIEPSADNQMLLHAVAAHASTVTLTV